MSPELAKSVTDAITGADEIESASDRPIGEQRDDFARFFVKYRELLQRRAFRYLSDPRDVEDVLQETFIRVFLALDELETERSAIRFAQRVLVNLCIDQYRTQQRRPRCIDLDAAASDLTDEDFDDPLVRAEDAAVVRQALALLSPQHREALVKREIEDKPLATVAHELDVPEDQVRVLLYRARRALRRLLVGSSVDPDAPLSAGEVGVLVGRRVASAAGSTAGRSVAVVAVIATGIAACVAGLQASTSPRGTVASGTPSFARPFGVPAVPDSGPHPGARSHRTSTASGASARIRRPATTAGATSGTSPERPAGRHGTPAGGTGRHSIRPLRIDPPPSPSAAAAEAGHAFALHGLLHSRSAAVAHPTHVVSDGGRTIQSTADFVAQTTDGLFVMAQTLQLSVAKDGTTTAAGSAAPDIPIAGEGTSYAAAAMRVSVTPGSNGFLVTMSGVATSADGNAPALDVSVVAHFNAGLTAIGSEQVYISADDSSPGSGQATNPSSPPSSPPDSATPPPADATPTD